MKTPQHAGCLCAQDVLALFFKRVLRQENHVDLLSVQIFFRQKKNHINVSVDPTPLGQSVKINEKPHLLVYIYITSLRHNFRNPLLATSEAFNDSVFVKQMIQHRDHVG